MANKNINQLLNELIDEDGLKTNVSISMTTGAAITAVTAVVSTVALSSLAYYMIRSAFNQSKP